MKILALSKEIPPVVWDSLEEVLCDEAALLHQLYLDDHVREFYFTGQGEAVLILEADSAGEAQEILGQLPLVKGGYIRFEVTELRPYTGFSRLF